MNDDPFTDDPTLFSRYADEFQERSEERFNLELTGAELISLIGAFQLACRHPGFNGPTKVLTESIVRSWQQLLPAAPESALGTVLEMGWDDRYDNLDIEEGA